MGKQKIVPDLIPVAPKDVIEIKYGEISVNMGNQMTTIQVKVCINSLFFINYSLPFI